jgi:hypothetical protein
LSFAVIFTLLVIICFAKKIATLLDSLEKNSVRKFFILNFSLDRKFVKGGSSPKQRGVGGLASTDFL